MSTARLSVDEDEVDVSGCSDSQGSDDVVSSGIRKRSYASSDDLDTSDGLTRKEKSLGLLCKKFLICMGEEAKKNRSIHLDSITKTIDVEKRRVYDIVNVMEALEAMSKENKSYYRWEGLTNLPRLMARLKAEAEASELPKRIEAVAKAMCSFTELVEPAATADAAKRSRLSNELVGTTLPDKKSVNGVWPTHDGAALRKLSPYGGRDRNTKNSLSTLCRRFLMVLLSSPTRDRRVSLDVASTVLIKDPETEGYEPPSRSRCRRLYDIANVLVAMGLIAKKHYLFGTKKIPLFVYSGPEPDADGHLDQFDPAHLLLSSSSPKAEVDDTLATVAPTATSSTPVSRQPSLYDICEIAERERERLQREAHAAVEQLSPVHIGERAEKKAPSPNENDPSGGALNLSLSAPPSRRDQPRSVLKPLAERARPAPLDRQRPYLVKIGASYHIQQPRLPARALTRVLGAPSPFRRVSPSVSAPLKPLQSVDVPAAWPVLHADASRYGGAAPLLSSYSADADGLSEPGLLRTFKRQSAPICNPNLSEKLREKAASSTARVITEPVGYGLDISVASDLQPSQR